VGRYTCISVSREVFEKLAELKRRIGARDWDEFMEKIIAVYLSNREVEARIVVCNHLREAKGPLHAWVKLLQQKLDPDQLAVALEYLKPLDDKTTYAVDTEKCTA